MTKPIRTNTSNLFGSVLMTGVEQGLLHPIDTGAKRLMAGKPLQFGFNLASVRNAYDGFAVGLAKKAWVRGVYKWPFNAFCFEAISTKCGPSLTSDYGPKKAKLIITSGAAVLTGMGEPLLAHPMDTWQIRLQALGRTPQTTLTVANVRALGITGLYNGALFTGVFRNIPGCLGLFTGSALANSAFDNDDHANPAINLGAKFFGGFLSIVASQPGDVLKTNMQTHGYSLSESLGRLDIKAILTRGLLFRTAIAAKIGIGYFMAEWAMNQSGALINGYEEDEELNSGPSPKF